MFKVALVVPNGRIKFASDCSPPLNLAYLASMLRSYMNDVDVKIFDGTAKTNVWHELFCFQPNIVGLTATTPLITDAYDLADTLRKCRPDITVILGGPHVSVLPDEALAHADYVVVGEGENAIVDIANKVKAEGKPAKPKIVYGVAVECLDHIPRASFELLDMSFYLSRSFLQPIMNPPVMGLVTSRGCPVKPACVFCYNSWNTNKVRYFSAKRVIEDLMFLHEKYGVSNFFFQDDEFLINRKRLEELAYLIKEHGCSWLKWGCQARVTSLTKELLVLAESIGCVLIVPGIESYNPRILNYLKNGSVKQSDIDRAVKLFACSKITLMANFVVGTPTETFREMWDSVDFYIKTPELTSMIVNVLTPYPGTQAWNDCNRLGLLPENIDYSRLIPTQEGHFNVSTANQKDFKVFLRNVSRICWVIRTVRFKRGLKGFFGLWKAKTWWWMWLVYPDYMWALFSQCRKDGLRHGEFCPRTRRKYIVIHNNGVSGSLCYCSECGREIKVELYSKHRYFDECGLYDEERQRHDIARLCVAEKQKKTVDGEKMEVNS